MIVYRVVCLNSPRTLGIAQHAPLKKCGSVLRMSERVACVVCVIQHFVTWFPQSNHMNYLYNRNERSIESKK